MQSILLLIDCQGILKISPPLLGIIRRDQKVPESIRAQVPLLVRYPNSTATEDVELRGEWSSLEADDAQSAISTLDNAIKSLAKSIQSVGDYNARLSSKEESLSLAVSNTEATRSRIEDADFAKEQMSMMKLQILQQTSVSSFSQANSAPQMVLSLLR